MGKRCYNNVGGWRLTRVALLFLGGRHYEKVLDFYGYELRFAATRA